jgi:hypothetical protein
MINVACMEEMRYPYKILVRKPEDKRPLGMPMRRCKDNIRMNFREIGWEVVDWMHVAQDRVQRWALVNMVMNLGFHKLST